MKSPNRYFNNFNFGPTQKLYEDLIIEAIRIHGFWINYLPRTSLNMDDLFGESTANSFDDAILIEAYMNNPEGFDGQRLMSKFGVDIQEETRFTISQKRFEEVRQEYLIAETGETMEQELTNRYHPNQFNGILLEEGNIEGYHIPYSRPKEGDLVWVPVMQKLYEIKFVQHDNIFYQGGALQTFDLFCEVFEYSHEKLDTGNFEIDNIENLFSGDIMRDPITTESGDPIELEDDQGNLTSEEVNAENSDAQADNKLIQDDTDGVVDFSEKSPFVKRNEHFKW